MQITSKLPRDKIASKEERAAKCKERIDGYIKEIKDISERSEEIEGLYDYCKRHAERYKAIGDAGETAHTVLIKGYVTERDLPYLEKQLNKQFTVVIEAEDADNEKAPVVLENNAFARPPNRLLKCIRAGSARYRPHADNGIFLLPVFRYDVL